jgi:hypothetical protein
MTVKIYQNSSQTAVFVEDNNGAQFMENLKAVMDSEYATDFRIQDISRNNLLFTNLQASDVVDENDQVYGATVSAVVNELNNNIFASSGTPDGSAPVITSATTVNLTEGDTLNYELTATGGVGYEWNSLPIGVTTVEGNARKLIGGSDLSSGTYNFTATAINYFGQDSETISLVVSAPPFSNTKSINFSNQDWLGPDPTVAVSEQVQKIVEPILGRTGNGSGSGDAWSISLWYKPSTANQGQVILYFGDSDTANGGYIQIMQINVSGGKCLRLRYGSNNNNLRLQTSAGSLVVETWQHILITYDGGTTGASSADVSDYYSRFAIYIDGVLQSTSNSESNYGWTGSVDADNFRIGRQSGNYMRGTRVDEIALWGSDQSSNVASIYNSGTPFDLDTLTTSPDHWWRMGDGDTFPDIQDNVGTGTFRMYNMTAADIVNDVP